MYTKTNWVARVGTALNRFLKSNESSGSVELTNDPTGVTTAGTPFTVANMNKIEQGIYDNDQRLDQSVKTTDDVKFNNINPPVDNTGSVIPSLGIGGFSFATTLSTTTKPSLTIPAGGNFIIITTSQKDTESISKTGLVNGEQIIEGEYTGETGIPSTLTMAIWRMS